jgi:hypothetical protein
MMKHILLLLTISLTLFAQNPRSFAALGDVIYDDVATFEKLKTLPSMQEFSRDIDSYSSEAKKTKEMGFLIDAKDKSVDAKSYLAALRKLSEKHDMIMENSTKRFKEALHDEDGETINAMVEYGVIDTEDYDKELINYYEEFNEDQNLSSLNGFYTKYLTSLVKEKKVELTEAQREQLANEANIKRMRAKNEAKDAKLAKSVKEEQDREKKKVLDEQKKELGIN